MALAKMKHRLLYISLLLLASPLLAGEKAGDKKEKYFLSTNVHQTKIYKQLSKLKVPNYSVKNTSARKACEVLLDLVNSKKGQYSNLVVLEPNQKKISLTVKNSSFTEILDQICKEGGLKWTIFFYSNDVDYPMLGIAPKDIVSEHAKKIPSKNE